MTAAAVTDNIPGRELLEGCDKPAVILFHTSWCSVCKNFVPEVEKTITAENDNSWGGKFRLVKIDVDKYGALADSFGVKSVPTMVGFHGDKASVGVIGRLPRKMLMTFLAEVEKFHKQNPPPAWMAPEPGPGPTVEVNTSRSIKVMKPLQLKQKKQRFTWLR